MAEELIASGQTEAFNQVLAQAHQQWLTREPAAKDGLEQYLQSWPFVPTTNIGLVEDGVIAQYNSYEIASYSSDQPNFLIPYSQLQGILN